MHDALTVSALHPSGFAICLQVPSLEALEPTIADLLQRGYRPTSGAGDGWQRTPEGHPLCPKHRVPMRLRSKQGDEWWSHQVIDARTGEELYCRGYAGPTSRGWWGLRSALARPVWPYFRYRGPRAILGGKARRA